MSFLHFISSQASEEQPIIILCTFYVPSMQLPILTLLSSFFCQSFVRDTRTNSQTISSKILWDAIFSSLSFLNLSSSVLYTTAVIRTHLFTFFNNSGLYEHYYNALYLLYSCTLFLLTTAIIFSIYSLS